MILVLGGTTEGRATAEVLDEARTPFYYSTRYGEQKVDGHNIVMLSGAMDERSMADFCKDKCIKLIVDAAHPFATRLHSTVADVASSLGLPVIRFERIYTPIGDDVVLCVDFSDAVRCLGIIQPKCLLALTGLNTIEKLRPYWEKNECYFRVLDRKESREKALAAGIDENHLLYYNPDVPTEEIIEQVGATALITKQSGLAGGVDEKLNAARSKGIKAFVVLPPPVPESFIVVDGKLGLRKEIDRLLPEFFPLHTGITTGTCATAASKAALTALLTGEELTTVDIKISSGETLHIPVKKVVNSPDRATATVSKYSGDDPDVTDGCDVVADVEFVNGDGIIFSGGEGVGRVTLPGLGLEPGEPAINPVPRRMIAEQLGAMYKGGLKVTISVPGGSELAAKTFNPRVGIVDGISIIGTSGIVRPFSHEAFLESIKRQVDMCIASGIDHVVINSGARSERIVKGLCPGLPSQAFIHYGNAIGDTLAIIQSEGIGAVTMGIMIGKAVKLAEGNTDTHSHNVVMNKNFVIELAKESSCSDKTLALIERMTLARELWTILEAEEKVRFMSLLIGRCKEKCADIYQGELKLCLIPDKDDESPVITQ